MTVLLAAVGMADAAVTWCSSVDVAAGGGFRGPWRGNESRFDYVDDPSVALDARGAAAVTWVDQSRKDVFFQVYGRDGKSRHPEAVNVSRTPRVFSWLPRVVLSPTHPSDVYILWQEIVFSGGSHGGDIFFARSRDGGATFDQPLNLSSSIAGDGKGRVNRESWHNGSLDLAIGPDGTLYAAWTEYEGPLWLSRSTDRGATFSRPAQVGGSKQKPARAPALAPARDGTVYLAWTLGEDESADVRIARSSDGGRTFGEPRIVERTKGYSDAPKIAVDTKGIIHIAYGESAGGPFERQHVRYARSRDQGRTFEAAREISAPHPRGYASAAFPSLSVDAGDNVYVLWQVYRQHREMPRGLALTVSRDAGASFSGPIVVSEPSEAFNGGQQGLLMRKLAVNDAGDVAVMAGRFKPDVASGIALKRGVLDGRAAC